MFKYRLVNQRVPAMCLSLAAARLMAELPSGKGTDDGGRAEHRAYDEHRKYSRTMTT